MREAPIITFGFKFVNRFGLPDSLIRKIGSVSRDGLILNDEIIFYRDIFKIERHRNTIIVVLMPYSTVSKKLSKYFFKGYSTFVINIGGFADEVQSIINRRISSARIADSKLEMTEEEIKRNFKSINCPVCDANINLTELVPSVFIYCHYCESVFDHYSNLIPGGKEYRICPETGLFDRVKNYYEYQMYFNRYEFRFKLRKFFCGDTYVHFIFERNFWKNFSLLIGVLPTAIEKIRSTSNRNQNYPELVKANIAALEGRIQEVEFLFDQMLMRNKNHPGLYLNLGIGYLEIEKKEKAGFNLKKALESCSNYQPALDLLWKHEPNFVKQDNVIY
ncbi:MAG: hypothetical protein KTR26_05815 [Flammeovirgaceae bacterium]|nr:hypothetical protein [Flammeovirgaceae bacterium]